MKKTYYKVKTNSGWAPFWGLTTSYEKETQKMLDDMSSKGWQLHSFSLRNGMFPNVPFSLFMFRNFIRISTLGFLVYQYGGTWVFEMRS